MHPFASSCNFFCFIIFLFLNEATSLFKLGAAAVNLVAGEKPPDVYSEIAARLVIVCDNFSFVMPSFSKNYDGVL